MRDDVRLTGLDFMRAMACLLVFAHHTTQRLDYDALAGGWRVYYRFFNMGAFGVAIFFLLSGFLLARPFWLAFDAGTPMPSLATYALRRAARIVPGHYLALAVSAVLAATVFSTALSGDIVVRFLAGLFFVGEFQSLTLFPVEVNGPLWSIGMEVASYVLLPLGLLALFALRSRLPAWRGRIVFAGVVGVALLAHLLAVTFIPKQTVGADFGHGLVGGAAYWMPQFNVAGFFVVFALGGLTAGLSSLWTGPRHLAGDLLVVAGLVAAGAALWSVSLPRVPEAFGWLGIPYDFPAFHLGIMVALFAFPHARYLPLLSELPPVRFVATISFGIYIWHFLVLELMRQLAVPNYHWGGMSNLWQWLEITTICLILSLIAGTASWYLVEAPVLRWAKRLESRGQTGFATLPRQNLHA